MSDVENQGIGNCGYFDPLFGWFEDGDRPAPWWVPLTPAGPITECQAWAAFLRWWCEPLRWKWEHGKHSRTPEGERWWDAAYDVTVEFRERAR